jgi:hypothetical protein
MLRFEKYGDVENCSIMLDPHTKESRGFGFVNMVTAELRLGQARVNTSNEEVRASIDGTFILFLDRLASQRSSRELLYHA